MNNLPKKVYQVEEIKMSQSSVTMETGDDIELSATALPENAENKDIEWKSSNTAVATVSAYGRVSAKGEGTAVITAYTANGVSANCTVTVTSPVHMTFQSFPLSRTDYRYDKSIEQKYTITEAKYVYSYHGSSGYVGKLYFSGIKDYDYRGSGQSAAVKIGWKVYQGNIVVDSGTTYSSAVATGEGFAQAYSYVTVPDPGTYRVEILNSN